MPNWCYTQMVVYGNATEIKDFHERLLKAQQEAEESQEWFLYRIYVQFGYSKEKILNSDTIGYIRGNVCDIQLLSDTELKVTYESAWAPMIGGFDYLLETHYISLKEVTLAEEPGNEVYINTDTKHTYFDIKYCVDVEDYDTYYVSSDKEVVRIINEWNDTDKKCETIQDCYELLDKNDGYVGSKHTYITLNEYSA